MHDVALSFFDALADKVVDRLEKKQNQRQRLLGLESAAEYLGMTPEALRQKTLGGEIPKVALDTRLRYDIRDLDRLIENSKI